MKKLVSFALVLIMCVAMLAGCSNEAKQPEPTPTPVPVVENTFENAVSYLRAIYRTVAEVTPKDFQRIGTVPVGDTKYEITWTVDVAEDLVKIVKGEDGMITIDVNEDAAEETAYVLTATLTDAEGKSESLTWNHILPAGMDVDGLTYAQIVELGYALAESTATEDAYRLFGTVTAIDTAWSDEYKNITVTIAVAGLEDKPIMCYRLKGEGAKDLAVGDAITVEGILKNYKGTIEFDAGCVLVGMGEHVDQSALLKAAFALGDGVSMDFPAVATGTVTKIVSAWSDEYQNITVDFQVAEDKVMQAYRLSGEGAKDLAVGDVITVAGIIKNYKGTIEFDAGCKLIPNELYHSMKNALSGYKLEENAAQEVAKTITGEIVKIDTVWSEDYQNITVTVVVGGVDTYPIMFYRLKGEGAKELAVGDVITATGILKNYKGTIEFDAGCTLEAVVKNENAPEIVVLEDPIEIVAAAYALEAGAALGYESTLTGELVSIDTEYSEQYGNITVTMVVEGCEDMPIVCFRMKGDEAATLAVGDIITVTGSLINYNGTIEFNAGCIVSAVEKAVVEEPVVEEPVVEEDNSAAIVTAAYALEDGTAMEEAVQITGKIISVDKPWTGLCNLTVTIAVEGCEDMPVQCYRLSGHGAKILKVDDVITVEGTLRHYNGLVQFVSNCTLIDKL